MLAKEIYHWLISPSASSADDDSNDNQDDDRPDAGFLLFFLFLLQFCLCFSRRSAAVSCLGVGIGWLCCYLVWSGVEIKSELFVYLPGRGFKSCGLALDCKCNQDRHLKNLEQFNQLGLTWKISTRLFCKI